MEVHHGEIRCGSHSETLKDGPQKKNPVENHGAEDRESQRLQGHHSVLDLVPLDCVLVTQGMSSLLVTICPVFAT